MVNNRSITADSQILSSLQWYGHAGFRTPRPSFATKTHLHVILISICVLCCGGGAAKQCSASLYVHLHLQVDAGKLPRKDVVLYKVAIYSNVWTIVHDSRFHKTTMVWLP
jgi:hypothetical protein